MKKYRFVPKRYGWGFVPVTREGRLTTLFIIAMVIAAVYRNGLLIENGFVTQQQAVGYLLDIVLIVGVISRFCEKHMKEPLKRRWGGDDTEGIS